jgi:hypothetical protein
MEEGVQGTLKGLQSPCYPACSPLNTVLNIWEGPSQSTLLNMVGSEFTQQVYCFLPLFTGSQKISHMYKIGIDRGMVTNRARDRV